MEKYDIKVGDKITYKCPDGISTKLITFSLYLEDIKCDLKNKRIEILKIERIGENGWYTVYEKKELLTDEEKEFLKLYIKYVDKNIDTIGTESIGGRKSIYFTKSNSGYYYYPNQDYFKGLELDRKYTLKDLGLEEEDE